MGALDSNTLSITPLGHTMSLLPVSPCYAKMLSLAHQNGCLPYMVIIVAALSVREVFLSHDETNVDLKRIRRAWVGQVSGLMLCYDVNYMYM